MSGYLCELCGTDRGNYVAMMACESECHADSVAARKNHASARVMRPMPAWDDD